jgi:hypothetical protein
MCDAATDRVEAVLIIADGSSGSAERLLVCPRGDPGGHSDRQGQAQSGEDDRGRSDDDVLQVLMRESPGELETESGGLRCGRD